MKIAVAKARRSSSSLGRQSLLEPRSSEVQAQTSLWSRFARWAHGACLLQDMTLEWTCCGTPSLDSEVHLGRVESFELSISACAHCGALWLDVCSVATTVVRTAPLSRTDAEAILAAAPGPERRALMQSWLRRHLQQAGSRALRS